MSEYASDNQAAALGYAARGWYVLPLHNPTPDGMCSCGAADCGSIGKHPRTEHGLHDATTDPAKIRDWWTQWPAANVGVRTGTPSGFFVLDVDGDEAGAGLRESGRACPQHALRQRTGCGWQVFFSLPADFKVRNTTGAVGDHVDTRGEGGYVVVAPSLHANGKHYRWLAGGEPGPAPEWLLDALRPVERAKSIALPTAVHPSSLRPYLAAALEDEVSKVQSAPDGRRNATLNEAAFSLGQLEAAGLTRAEAENELTAAGLAVGLAQREIVRTFQSGWLAGRQDPREIPSPNNNGRRTPETAAEAVTTAPRHAVRWQPAPTDEWEQPLRLDTPAGLPPFPVHVLPPILRDFVTEVAESRQVPADMPALAVLGVLAACTAGRYRVDLPTHSEPCNLYLLCGVEPGTRKSQTMRDATAPLHESEALMVEQARQGVDEARAARDVAEQRAKQLQTKAAKLDDPLERRVLQAELAELLGGMADPVSLPRLTFDDATPERVAQLLAENRGRLAMLSAEGGIVGMMAGRYSDRSGPNLDVYLKAHAGDPLRVDRASGRTLHLKHPALTLCLMVQPQVLRELADVQGGRGRGLLGRFCYSLPLPNLGRRAYRSRAIDPQAASRYGSLVAAMLAQPLEDEPQPLSLRGGALAVWVDFYSGIEERQREGGDLRPLADWASKAAGVAARIAGCLHAAEHAHNRPERVPITPETAAAAVAVADYFVHHALAAFGVMGDSPVMALARRVAGWLDRRDVTTFTLRDLHQDIRKESPRDLLPALRLLEQRAIVRELPPRPQNPAGGRPSQRFAVNPNLANRSQNSQYLEPHGGSVGFVNETQELKDEEPEPFAATHEADGSRLVAL